MPEDWNTRAFESEGHKTASIGFGCVTGRSLQTMKRVLSVSVVRWDQGQAGASGRMGVGKGRR